jgi:CelD/BcsL family acetyltransferase involved in cellulose biosynthesis/glycosyltransferase involved in cell wall biosynthesis
MLRILNVAYPFAEVTSQSIGGAEQILAEIDAALVEAGHESLVLARRGSAVRGELIAVDVPDGSITAEQKLEVWRRWRQELAATLGDRAIDVVHYHGVDCAEYLLPTARPSVVTLHLPLELYPSEFLSANPSISFTCVSESQRAACVGSVPIAATIANGVDLARWFPDPDPPGGYAICIGRICPEKGFERALAAAHAAGLPLLLLGRVFPYPEHERYFAEQILPLLDDSRRFLGPVTGSAKRRLLAGADCLVVPSRVAETSSLVTMEALACGTPVVVACPGAPASLIEAGVSGWVVSDESRLPDALRRRLELDRAACRRRAEQRFDVQRMKRAYLSFYETLCSSRADAPRLEGAAASGPRPQRCQVEVITSLSELRALRSSLWELYARVPAATPFQAPSWVLEWIECFAAPGCLRAITVYSGSRLVGFLPLVLEETDAGDRVARLVGCAISDYLDALIDPHEPSALSALSDALAESCVDVDRLHLSDLQASSPLLGLARDPRLRLLFSGTAACPRLELPASFPDYLAGRPAWLVRNLRQTEARLGRLGELVWDQADPDTLGTLLSLYFELHGARWQTRGQCGVLQDPAVQAFHRRSAPELLAHGALELSVLRLDGRPIGASYVLKRRSAYLYLTGFDPSFARLSIGSLLIARSIQAAIRHGLRQYDFLRGQEAYKYAWGALDVQTRELVLQPIAARGAYRARA